MAMTKAELVEIVCEKTGFARHESAEFLEKVFAIMKETLEKGEKIKISGFGNFVVREKKPRKGIPSSHQPQVTLGAQELGDLFGLGRELVAQAWLSSELQRRSGSV
jgi:integration host factor subunit alpha